MSSVSGIADSILASLYSASEEKASTEVAATSETESSAESETDSLSLSEAALEMAGNLFDSIGNNSSNSGYSGNSMYDLLSSAESQSLITSNPGLVKTVATAGLEEGGGVGGLNFLSMDAADLASLLKEYGATDSTGATASTIDETA
jgi:hypothetical protein